MANDQNLIPVTMRSQEDAKRISQLGGEATKSVRKNKKDLKEKIEAALEILKSQTMKKMTNAEQKKILGESDILVYKTLEILGSNLTKRETKLKAVDMLLDRMYGKPKQETDITSNGESIQPQIIISE